MTSGFAILAALALSLQAEPYDAIVLSSGDIVRGTVVEDLPGQDLVILMPDGTTRRIPRAEIARVEWAVPPESPVGAVPPPTSYPGEPPAPPPPEAPEAPGPIGLAFWCSVAFPGGRLDASGLAASSILTPEFSIGFEWSWRVADPLQLGVYLRLGGGGASGTIDDQCLATSGARCDAADYGVGLFPRWNFAPRGPLNPWVQVGYGFEYLAVRNDWCGVEYTGWEMGAWAGLDFLRIEALGGGTLVTLAGVRWGEFTTGVPYGGLDVTWGGGAMHWWLDLGVRFAWP